MSDRPVKSRKILDKNEKIEVSFESHPPIESDLDGVCSLLKQTFLNHVDCQALAKKLIKLDEITQIIALGSPDDDEDNQENKDEDDEEDQEDDNIYGVTSVINLTESSQDDDVTKQMNKFLKDKFKPFNELVKSEDVKDVTQKIGFIISERFINLPPQLALATLENLSKHLDQEQYTYLIMVCKIMRAKNETTFVNPEEEIIFELSRDHADINVGCDNDNEVAGGDDGINIRRCLIIDYKNSWPGILKSLADELKSA